MDAARRLGIDHRWVYLWAEQGKVGHLEVESSDGRHKTYYVMADLEREVALLRASIDTPEWDDGYVRGYRYRFDLLDRLSDTLEEVS